MSLRLPEDVEPWITDYQDLHSPAAYALTLRKPTHPCQEWGRHYDTRPPWFPEFLDSDGVIYVGGTTDLLSRLEDHRDGDVRNTLLTRVCEIEGLRTVWLCGESEVWVEERKLARTLQREHPEIFVRQA